MNRYTLGAVAVSALAAAPATAHAITFDFSFTGSSGGVVTGELIFSAAAGTHLKPTDVVITGAPAKLTPPATPYTMHQNSVQGNGFTISDGHIIGGRYYVSSNHNSIYATLVLNYAASNNYYRIGTSTGDYLNVVAITDNAAGFAGATYTAAPEPASIALLGAGLAGIASFRRRGRG